MNKTEIYAKLNTPRQSLAEGEELLIGLKRAELVEMANDLHIDVFADESNKVLRHNIVMFGFFLPRQRAALRKMSGHKEDEHGESKTNDRSGLDGNLPR